MKTIAQLLFTATLLFVCNALHAQQTIFVNEIMASNNATITDANGNFEDWFEVFNSSAEPVDLTNYYVTDDFSQPTKFQLSDLTVPGNGYLILWASGSTSGGNDHLPFKLSASGEGIFLFQPDGVTLIDSVSFGPQKTDISYGRVTDGSASFGYFKNPTPATTNNTSQTYLGFLDAPVLSVAAGFYADPFALTITDADTTASIVYTTNGSMPDINNLNGKVYRYKNKYPQAGELPYPFLYDSFKSQLYSQPLQITDATSNPNRLCLKSSTFDKVVHYFPTTNINKATLIRAIAVKDGYISSPETVSTYFVTPNGINHYTLPVVSLGIQEDYMFSWDSGMYCAGMDFDNWRLNHPNTAQNGGTTANYRRNNEFPLTVEFFEDGAASGKFETNAGFQMHGDYSLAKPQKSLNIYLRSEYGSSDLNYKLFPDRPYTDYQRFILRNSGNDEGETRIRDMSIEAAISHLKFDTQASRPSIVFIGGEYTGLLNITTKYDQNYFAQVYGIQEDQLDYLENNAFVNNGDNTDYLNLRNFIQHNSMTNATNYDSVGKRMDLDNYIDYYISKIFFGCADWPGNNIAYFRKRVPYTPNAPVGEDGRYRWVSQDDDSGLGFSDSASDNTLQLALGNRSDEPRPSWSTVIFKKLTTNPNFKNNFINRYCDLLNTSFLPARVISVITYYHDLIAPEMPEHIARWHNPGSLDKWNSYVNAMDTFAAQRPTYAFQHLQSFGSLSARQQITLNVSDTSAGFIHINTIDITPSFPGVPQHAYPWNGFYFPNVPVTIIAVAKPGYRFLHWQGDNTSTKDTLSVSLTTDKSFIAIFQKDITPAESLIDYWHFNNLPQPPAILTSVIADSTATGNAVITYEGTGAGYMDYTDTSSAGYPFGKQEGSNVNSQLGQIPGNALRPRNPSNTRYLLINAPTTGYKNIKIKYAAVRTNKGAQYQRVSYTIDGNTWILKQDSILMPSPETVPFILDSLNFSADVNVSNNPLFAVKIEFFGTQSSGSSGNDRFDNITVSGYTIGSCGIPYGLTATNITTSAAAVSWDSVSDANNYDVDYKIHTDTIWTNAATATTLLTTNLSSLSANTLYDYRVRCNCSFSSGDYDTAQFTTLSGPTCNIVYDGAAHNTFGKAVLIPLNTSVNGTISSATDTDYYKFKIPVKETATIILSTLPANYDLYIYNSSHKLMAASTNAGTISETTFRTYVKATFYIKVAGVIGTFNTANCYTLNIAPGMSTLVPERLTKDDAIADNSLQIFPNPVSSVLNVNTLAISPGAVLKVINIFGKTVLSQRLTSSNSRINVSKLPASTYLLVIIDKSGSIINTSKFVKQ